MTNTNVNNSFLGGSFSVSNSTAGATTSVAVTHTDNTNTGSKSYFKIETGGSSAGDAFLSCSNSVVNFSLGLDNSDSDAFVMSENSAIGTTNVARCDADGIWTYPSNACFSVNANNSAANNVTGEGTIYNPLYGTEVFDVGGDYDTGTYTFTAPVTGVYIFTGQVNVSGGSTRIYIVAHLEVNGSQVVSNLIGCAATTYQGYCPFSAVYPCTAGDSVKMSVQAGGDASKIDDFTGNTETNYFMGGII